MADLLEHGNDAPIQRVKFGTRLGAFLLDTVIVWVALVTILVIMVGDKLTLKDLQEQLLLKASGGLGEYVLLSQVISGGVLLVELFTGLTIAKFILGLRIGDVKGRPAPIQNLLLRGSLKAGMTVVSIVGYHWLPAITTPGSIISIAWFFGCFAALSSNHQALHDTIGKTAVYRKKDMDIAGE